MCDRHHHAFAVGRHRDVVGPPAQWNLFGDLAGFLIDDIERGIGFIADVDRLAVGRKRHTVRGLDALDHLHDLVGGRVDEAEETLKFVIDSVNGFLQPDYVFGDIISAVKEAGKILNDSKLGNMRLPVGDVSLSSESIKHLKGLRSK